jgi:hypothetical protein
VRLAIDRLLSDGLTLELPREGSDPDSLELERGVGVRGVYASDRETIAFEGVQADELDAARVTWHVGQTVRVLAAPLVLGGAELDARIARGALHGRQRFVGHVAARELAGRAIGLDIGSTRLAAASVEGAAVSYRSPHGEPSEVRLTRLALLALAVAAGDVRVELEAVEGRGGAARFGGGAVEIALATLEIRGGRAKIGDFEIAFGAAAASDVRLTRGAGGWQVGFGSLSLRALELRTPDARVVVSRVELAEGLRHGAEGLVLPACEIAELEVEATLPEPAPRSGTAMRGPPLDLRFLDLLSGRLHVDVNVDVRLPVIKRRVATHEFRIPIDRGTIDFHELERDLAFLEDAVLDFKVKGDRLVFQKDIPLVPFDEETIVYWSLEDDEIELASRNRVRLRRLAHPKQPERKREGDSSVELVQLDVDPIEAVLHLDGPGDFVHGGLLVRLGAPGKHAFAELRVAGALRHRPNQAPQPGELRIDLRELRAGFEGLVLAGRAASVASVEIDAVADARVSFSGVRPRAVRGTVRGLKTRGVRLGGV